MAKRTAKDEYEYDATLRRENDIKTEVIVELREQNKLLWKNQAMLLELLIQAQDSLRVYRLQLLEGARANADTRSSCVPGCTKHEWRTADGWHRQGAK